ncbi:hypothetical protein GCM10020254_73070 [Streptomyces goshikiensis]
MKTGPACQRERRAVRAGSSPARTREDLPDPEGPTTVTNRRALAGTGGCSRATSSAVSRSRPKNTAASASPNASRPGYGGCPAVHDGGRGQRAPLQPAQPHLTAGQGEERQPDQGYRPRAQHPQRQRHLALHARRVVGGYPEQGSQQHQKDVEYQCEGPSLHSRRT